MLLAYFLTRFLFEYRGLFLLAPVLMYFFVNFGFGAALLGYLKLCFFFRTVFWCAFCFQMFVCWFGMMRFLDTELFALFSTGWSCFACLGSLFSVCFIGLQFWMDPQFKETLEQNTNTTKRHNFETRLQNKEKQSNNNKQKSTNYWSLKYIFKEKKRTNKNNIPYPPPSPLQLQQLKLQGSEPQRRGRGGLLQLLTSALFEGSCGAGARTEPVSVLL